MENHIIAYLLNCSEYTHSDRTTLNRHTMQIEHGKNTKRRNRSETKETELPLSYLLLTLRTHNDGLL